MTATERDNPSGHAALHVASVAGRSAVVGSWARSPLRLLTPRAPGQSVWAYTSTFGGGMVAGDRTRVDVRVDAGATCFLSTQASTKIYRNPARLPCAHVLNATLEDDALLILAPDPVQCFAEARYEQRQSFSLQAHSSLVLVDWLSAGRTARGERWAFDRYFSRNEIQRDGKKVLVDALLLDAHNGSLDAPHRTGRYNCFATVVVLGPSLRSQAAALLTNIGQQAITPRADLLVAASSLAEGVLVRLAGLSVEQVGNAISRHLQFVRNLLEDDPWLRKW